MRVNHKWLRAVAEELKAEGVWPHIVLMFTGGGGFGGLALVQPEIEKASAS